ncbi:MAG: hypothetical protein LBT14_00800 [Treponema sp.]|jgi:hypothetical protein|nr:hypothetical protein [Treponema sp.]
MFSDELKNVLIKIITSWQVIVVTLVMILYFSLVSYVVRVHRRPNTPMAPKPKKFKKLKTVVSEPVEAEADDA